MQVVSARIGEVLRDRTACRSGKSRRLRRRAALLTRVLLGAALAGCVSTSVHGAPPAPTPTLADDRVEASYNTGNQFVHDAELDGLLARLGKRLQAANPEATCVPLRIHALDVPLPYAFGLQNGAFYMSTGLLARLDSEAEMAALVALPLAGLCRGDATTQKADQRQRVLTNFVPNLLLITLTAGLTAPAIARSNAHQANEEHDRLRDASDAVALQWLQAADYDPAAAPRAMTHLLEALDAEHRTGAAEFSNPAQLTSRRDALERTLSQTAADASGAPAVPAAPATPPTAKDPYHALARRYALMLARADVDSYPVGLLPWLDRLEAIDGPSGYTAYLRAEAARRNSGSDADVPAAIAAYEKCVSFGDAPAVAYRELGFLYRRAGDQPRAREVLTKYLQRAPTAVDAPIIRMYLEAP